MDSRCLDRQLSIAACWPASLGCPSGSCGSTAPIESTDRSRMGGLVARAERSDLPARPNETALLAHHACPNPSPANASPPLVEAAKPSDDDGASRTAGVMRPTDRVFGRPIKFCGRRPTSPREAATGATEPISIPGLICRSRRARASSVRPMDFFLRRAAHLAVALVAVVGGMRLRHPYTYIRAAACCRPRPHSRQEVGQPNRSIDGDAAKPTHPESTTPDRQAHPIPQNRHGVQVIHTARA